ncbi:MAG: periplasmic heavy metal sensor [Lentisphaeria bacterium]|jgi:Spy/CpxP family protein refolding chaperone
MWKKLAPLLVVLSVALNLGFLGVWSAPRIRACRSGLDRGGQNTAEGVWCPLHRQLNVSSAQWHQLEPRMAEFRRRSQAVCQEVNRKRNELLDLVASPQPDRQAIAAKQEEILAGQRQVQILVNEHLLAEKETLTAGQQKELFDLLRKRGGCVGHGPMMFPGAESGMPGSMRDNCGLSNPQSGGNEP